jgi:hypothetical protein
MDGGAAQMPALAWPGIDLRDVGETACYRVAGEGSIRHSAVYGFDRGDL